jgi:hypothetical protein
LEKKKKNGKTWKTEKKKISFFVIPNETIERIKVFLIQHSQWHATLFNSSNNAFFEKKKKVTVKKKKKKKKSKMKKKNKSKNQKYILK